MKRKWLVRTLIAAGAIAVIWTGLTIWVETDGAPKLTDFTVSNDPLRVLIVYDPDPIYNLDEQICVSIAKGLNKGDVNATVATVKATRSVNLQEYGSVVVCANTYNWAPDASVTSFVKSNDFLRSVPVVAVTIGSGSTAESSARMKDLIKKEEIELLNDHEWWLMRPNDESRLEENNVDVANDQAFAFGERIASQLLFRRNSPVSEQFY